MKHHLNIWTIYNVYKTQENYSNHDLQFINCILKFHIVWVKIYINWWQIVLLKKCNSVQPFEVYINHVKSLNIGNNMINYNKNKHLKLCDVKLTITIKAKVVKRE